jgi:hypothetical protein
MQLDSSPCACGAGGVHGVLPEALDFRVAAYWGQSFGHDLPVLGVGRRHRRSIIGVKELFELSSELLNGVEVEACKGHRLALLLCG